ncbi:hypothetical protein DIPPA_64282 [Diplonema papillatum]|nr:hypothetical protein DIPPA_64282 [Diplonema papillatum]
MSTRLLVLAAVALLGASAYEPPRNDQQLQEEGDGDDGKKVKVKIRVRQKEPADTAGKLTVEERDPAGVLLKAATEKSTNEAFDLRYSYREGYGYEVVSKTKDSQLRMTVEEALAACDLLGEVCRAVVYSEVSGQDGTFMFSFLNEVKLEKIDGWGAYVKKTVTDDTCPDDIAAEVESDGEEKRQVSQEELDELEEQDDEPGTRGDILEEKPPSEDAEAWYQSGRQALFAPTDEAERNITLAVELFNKSAAEGHAGAQFMMGLVYTLGLGLPSSEILAILHFTFAAMGGNPQAALALAYRHTYGYGVPKSCTEAKKYYKMVADKAAHAYQAQSVASHVTKLRLSDPVALRTRQKDHELVQFYQYNADRGDPSSQLVLGYMFLWGTKGVTQDPAQAEKYFKMAAASGDAAAAFGALGTMHAYGVAGATRVLERDYVKAESYFAEGAKSKHPVSLNGLGYLHMTGRGVKRNYTKAVQYFSEAAGKKNPEAQYNLGVLFLEGKGVRKDKSTAKAHFMHAAKQGQVLAHWQLGNFEGQPCETSVVHLETVSGQGPWARILEEALEDYMEGDDTSALLKYLLAAETGHELAQANAAYLLDVNRGYSDLEFNLNPAYTLPDTSINTTSSADYPRHVLALKYYKKATEQDTVDAIVKVGDYHYYGLGTDVDEQKALASYKLGMSQSSHQAMFNLGYMYEHGISTPQDFHLAQRYYDQALRTSDHAYWPITLALIKLHIHWWLSETFWKTSLPEKATSPTANAASSSAKGSSSSAFTVYGHLIEDIFLGSLLLLLFLTLFVRHTARQVQVVVAPPARRRQRDATNQEDQQQEPPVPQDPGEVQTAADTPSISATEIGENATEASANTDTVSRDAAQPEEAATTN